MAILDFYCTLHGDFSYLESFCGVVIWPPSSIIALPITISNSEEDRKKLKECRREERRREEDRKKLKECIKKMAPKKQLATKDSNKTIQLDTFQVFKLFAANKNKPPEIISVLVTNRSKILRFLGDFSIDKEDEQFEADKAQVIKEIATLEIISERSCTDADDCEVES
ncbi:hypothetical protein OIU78_014983 [Salix suchowensis]|nr:hypothetical protein OIU78_014983 [Salix suchowensis]